MQTRSRAFVGRGSGATQAAAITEIAATDTQESRTKNVNGNDPETTVTHLYLMTDSVEHSDALYDLVKDLIHVGWEIRTHDRLCCFVHLATASVRETRLEELVRGNPWLRAYSLQRPLVVGLAEHWAARVEVGGYGGYVAETLTNCTLSVSAKPDPEFGHGMRTLYDSTWLATPPAVSDRAAAKDKRIEVALVATSTVARRHGVFQMTFHGLPDEVEQCRAFATEMLAEFEAPGEYHASGNDKYQAVVMWFETLIDPAMRVFNRLMARVPAATIVLEYEDPTTGKPRRLRAVDGKIDGGK